MTSKLENLRRAQWYDPFAISGATAQATVVTREFIHNATKRRFRWYVG
jgi:hypothetical protein